MKNLTPLIVRPYECDSYGHVNHAVYLNYLEFARMQFLHAVGFDYKGMIADGLFTVITRVDVAYRAPAFADEELTVETESTKMRRVGGTFHQVIRRAEKVLVEADVFWCLVNAEGRPTRMPEKFNLQGLLS